MEHPEDGFIGTKVKVIHIYAPPMATLAQYEQILNAPGFWTRESIGRKSTGNFTAWFLEWDSQTTNERGRVLLEVFAELNMILWNVGA